MSKTRLIVLTLVGVLMASLVGATSALAHEYQVSGGGLPQKIVSISGVSKLEGEVLGTKITIECSKDAQVGEIKAAGQSEGEVEFRECKVVGRQCEVPNIKFKFLDELIGTGGVEDEFRPASGTDFVEIEIKVCVLKGKYKVEGFQTCRLPGIESFAVIHIIECTPAGSSLTFAGKPAKFTSTEEVELVSGKLWLAK